MTELDTGTIRERLATVETLTEAHKREFSVHATRMQADIADVVRSVMEMRAAMEKLGMFDPEASKEMKELRGLLVAFKEAKDVVRGAVVRIITVGVLTAIAMAVGVKMNWLGKD